ncbi:class I SAM-dependent methyltransferase [Psychrobacter sp.]|uniref:class I SAM-dependent DNA methyltransferase n=1 Tax=Psychrobacter sp. TaxID=56811 RepID=UPI0025CF4C47|nr:class I SAM-dependent methyltransferase [Psychrobacter sp.]
MSNSSLSSVASSLQASFENSDLLNEQDSTAYSEKYFDALYSDNTDPWQYQTRWYEKRKRDMCLAVLPQANYRNAIELGCGNGVFSELLAKRCESLLSIDGNNQAVQLARLRMAQCSHVKVMQGIIPDALFNLNNDEHSNTSHLAYRDGSVDTTSFDLIVISEILYYLSPKDIDAVIDWISKHLAQGGTLLCCHWRYDIEGFEMNGEIVHQRLYQALNTIDSTSNSTTINDTHQTNQLSSSNTKVTFIHQSQLIDSDFLLDIWQNSSDTVAMSERLV